MDRTTVTRLLRRDFWPVLRAEGFSRRGEVARRADGPVVHVVEVVHRPRAGVFRVDLGVHVTLLGDVSGAPVDPATLREPGCAWRAGIVPGLLDGTSTDLIYGSSEEDAAGTVAFLVAEWPRQSAAFFGPLTTWPGQFHDAARAATARGLHPAHLRTHARVAALVGDLRLAREIAQEALPHVPERARALRADLEAVARDPESVAPTAAVGG